MNTGVMLNNPKVPAECGETEPDLLGPFFNPKRVVVFGACPKPGNLGWRIVESLKAQGFPGDVIAVHPDFPEQEGGGYRSLESVRENPDLAIAAVSAEATAALIEPVAQKGIHYMVAVSGGFAETGNRELQETMKTAARRCGIRVVGPNCLGIFSAPDRFNSFFLSPEELHLPKPGSIALISQSGAFLSMILNQLADRGGGVHRAINFGNRIDVGECDALEVFGKDPKVQAIGIYLESFQDGRRFFEQARAITPQKPVLIYKGGKSQSGDRATQAHSASLAGSYPVFQAMCRQTGMVEVFTLNELVDGLQVLEQPVRPQGNRLLIVSNGGGMGVLLTDLCEPHWKIDPPSRQDQDRLRQTVPEYYSLENPIDLTGSGRDDQCIEVLKRLLATKSYDALLLVLLPGTAGITPGIGQKLRESLPAGFPVVVGACGDQLYEAISHQLSKCSIPVYSTGEQAAQAVNLLIKTRPSSIRECTELEPAVEFDPLPLRNWLQDQPEGPGEMEFKSVLEQCGVPVPRRLKLSAENLAEVPAAMGFPLVLKANRADLMHKTEVGGVRLNIKDPETLSRSWQEMDAAWPGNVWVEEQVPPGLDVLVGLHRDETFGTILVMGTGGEYAEIYGDVKRMCWPASTHDLAELFNQTHAGRIAGGVRGKPPLSTSGLYGFIRLVADWMEREAVIRSLDFNPVRLGPEGFRVLDAKLTMETRGD